MVPDPADALDPTYLPPSARPGGAPSIIRRRRNRSDDDVRCEMVEEPPPEFPSLEPGSMLDTARNLLDALLGGLVGDPDPAIRSLFMLAAREASQRRATLLDETSGLPIATTPPAEGFVSSPLATEVRRALDTYVVGGVSDAIVGRATMGVEFVAGLEVEAPGTVDAYVGT